MADILSTQKCVSEFAQYKWLPGTVSSVWITPPDPNNTLEIQKYATNVTIEAKMENEVRTFYQVSPRFFRLQCNGYASQRVQNGVVLTCYEINGQPVRMIVGYVVKASSEQLKPYSLLRIRFSANKLLIQDEKVFEDEKKHMASLANVEQQRLTELLDKKVSNESVRMAASFLSSALITTVRNDESAVKKRIALDYGKDDINAPYIRLAVESVQDTPSQTNREFFTRIANVLVYIRLRSAENFRLRLSKEYYLPDILMRLSPEDKLPEIFDNELVTPETKENMASYVRDMTKNIVDEMGMSMLREINPTIRRLSLLVYEEPVVSLKKTENYADCEKIPVDNRAIYLDTDDGKMYCFDVSALAIQFGQKDFKNHITGKNFSNQFIRRYTVSYFDKNTRQEYVIPYKDLYDQFSRQDFVHVQTGRPFDTSFIQMIMGDISKVAKEKQMLGEAKGRDVSDLAEVFRGARYKTMDIHIAQCQNPEDVADAPLGNIVYYKDQSDGKTYCFPIPKLDELLKGEKINPRTGRKFSDNFIKKFHETFNVQLSGQGFNQKVFAEKYQVVDLFQDKELQRGADIGVWRPTYRGITYTEKEVEKVVAPNLIIPNLWELVNQDLASLENPGDQDADANAGTDAELDEETSDDEEETEPDKATPDDGDDVVFSDEEETEPGKATDGDEEETEPDKATDGDEEETEPDKATDGDEEETEPDKATPDGKKTESVTEEEETAVKTQPKHVQIDCGDCKKPITEKERRFKSIIYRDGKVIILHFCTLACMEQYKFPKVTGNFPKCPKE